MGGYTPNETPEVSRSVVTGHMSLTNVHAARRLALQLASIVFLFWQVLADRNAALRLLSFFLCAALVALLFGPLHECSHRTAFRDGRVNRYIAALLGFLLIRPSIAYRHFHLAHHANTNVWPGDPELDARDTSGKWHWALELSGLKDWARQLRAIALAAAGNAPDHCRGRVVRAAIAQARIYLCGYLATFGLLVATSQSRLFVIWLLLLLAGKPVLQYTLMTEHSLCSKSRDQATNTRVTDTNALMRYVSWSTNFHAVHHAYPAVPFHKLRLVYELTAHQFSVVARSHFETHRAILAQSPGAQ